jgi:hypothetical protein
MGRQSEIGLSPKGKIYSELFLELFKFFISSIPPARPVILLMDSHALHISPEVISLAKSHEFLLTFASHTTRLLQPPNVGIYKSLKSHWSQELNEYMKQNATEKPDRKNFHRILNPTFIKTVCAQK